MESSDTSKPELVELIPIPESDLLEDPDKKYMASVPGWTCESMSILAREFTFSSCAVTIAFFQAVWQISEEQGHHGHFTVHLNRFTMRITTHEAEHRLTEKDFRLARAINEKQYAMGVEMKDMKDVKVAGAGEKK